MLLRTRISLFASLAFVVICVCLAFAALQRERIITTQYSGEIISDRSTVWDRVIEQSAQRMMSNFDVVDEYPELATALARSDHAAIQVHAGDMLERLREGGVADRLDIVSADGTLAYSSLSGVFQSAVVSSEPALETMGRGEPVLGVGNDLQRNLAIVAATPLFADERVVGLAVYSTDIHKAIAEMEEVTRSTVVVVNRRGRLLAGTAQDLWRDLAYSVDLLDFESLQNLEIGDRVYSVIVVPQAAELGSLVANLVSVRDVTEIAAQQRRLGNLMIGGTAAALAVVVVLLNVYMAWAFAPLAAGIGMLNALSSGNLNVRTEAANTRDEIGRIANALNVFRAKLVAMDRFRQSRERQRGRQERFIRREMNELAETLDEEEQAAVLDELQQIEDLVQRRATTTDNTFERAAKELEGIRREQDPNRDGEPLDESSAERDGIAMMALAFQKMSVRVQKQNQSLREALAIKNALIAIQKELDIAARVQLSLLPPPLPENPAFQLRGMMKPAKEVGGDFYDFFRIDDRHIGIAVADVSGKGVPAALFMVMARTVLRATVKIVESPGQVLERVNDFLVRHNSEDLFVTFFYGVLHLRTGSFTYANGGHNPPLLVHEQEAKPLEMTGGVALGMFDGLTYDNASLDLSAGDRIIFISDGVTEAFNEAGEEFGDDRFLEAAAALPVQDAEADVKDIVREVEDFAGDAPQFDDITCVSLSFNGATADSYLGEGVRISFQDGHEMAESRLCVTIPGRLEELAGLAEIVEAHSAERGWPDSWAMKINISLDELITNVVSYGYGGSGPEPGANAEGREIDISFTERDNSLEIAVEDDGIAFNPFEEAPIPDVNAKLEDRPIGGLGVMLVKNFMSEVAWERVDGKNRVTMVLHGLRDGEE